ncbi:MAG TPA: phosphotransferase family protein [Stellaceae bacterium]|nr:phosphotransferase family protein [Stellaceae bacterium]
MAATPKALSEEPPIRKESLARFLPEEWGGIREMRRLRGGAIQENWCLTFEDGQRLVLRCDPAVSLGMGIGKQEEFAMLRLAAAAGVTVPEPLFFGAIEEKPFFLMRFVPGGRILEPGFRPRLAEALAGELARLHRLEGEGFDVARARLQGLDRYLDADPEPRPVAEWGRNWLRRHVPAPLPVVLAHGDFRTGNYLVEEERLTAVLDWEFAGWGDPDEDLAWFCFRCWRLGADTLAAGGIAPRAFFWNAYEAASGRRLDPERLHYWEVMAALRYLVIARLERDRFLAGGERSLQLALIGRRIAECEHELLRLIDGGKR